MCFPESIVAKEKILNFGDEYENLDEEQCKDQNKLRVKRAAILCNKMITGTSELFHLSQKCNEMIMEMDEATLYFNEIDKKLRDISTLIQSV